MSVRVLLADDQTVVRAGFRTLLDLTDDLVVAGEATDGQQAVSQARTLRPDVVLMDIRMPVMDGIEATRRIVGDPHLEAVRVLVLTTFDVDEYVFAALRAGASGFLLKDVDPPELHSAIRTVASGQSTLSPAATKRLIEEFTAGPIPAPVAPERLSVLTEREREVVRLVAKGLTNEEIAVRLVMSPLTAKTHVSRAMTKLHTRDRTQLAILAYETGLVRVGEPE
jgi:DNA-binding NarL/FixJ family response regulator